MNKQILKTMERLCGQLESVQHRLHNQAHISDEKRAAYEAVAKAKNEMIYAIGSYQRSASA